MLKSSAHILILEDDPDVAVAAEMLLRRRHARVQVLSDPARLDALLAREPLSPPDLVLLDFNFSPGHIDGAQGLAVLERLRRLPRAPAIIAMTAYADVPLAVEALKRGASDFITKPWDNARLVSAIDQALQARSFSLASAATAAAATSVTGDSGPFATTNIAATASSNTLPPGTAHITTSATVSPLMGHSAAMQALRAMIASVAPTHANVMILGENGVGKELVARAIHQASRRAGQTLLAVDMGAVPESTFESDMFGHRKGAFTDAKTERSGRFQAARGGTLFLDEIGNLPLGAQAKLLTALERREVTPLGADKPEAIDVRIISATNLDEVRLFDPAVFRTDLLFRLNTIVLRVPPLRERREDIPDLLYHYLAHYGQHYGREVRELPAELLARLSAAAWHGNVRALRHACERAVILSGTSAFQWDDFGIQAQELAGAMAAGQSGGQFAEMSIGSIHTADSKTAALPTSDQTTVANPAAGVQTLESMEREAVQAAMDQAKGNISHAAKALGLSRAALYRKLERHGI